MRIAWLFLLLAGLLRTVPAWAAEPRQLTIEEAERLALSENPSLQVIGARVKAAELYAKAGRSRMLPALAVSDDYQHWDSPFMVPFPGFPPFVAREQDTNTFALAMNQPLLGLFRMNADYRAQRQTAAADAAQLRIAKEAARQAVRNAYLHHFEAKAQEAIAKQSAQELEEQVTIARAKLKAGVLTNADVLRVQVAVANAQQQAIVAHTQAEVARASLLILIGLPGEEAVELREPSALLEAAHAETMSYSVAVQRAMAARPELLTAQLHVESAEYQERARLLALLPDINLQAGYTRVDGQVFAPANAAYIGLKASWLFWDWGATWFGYRAAQAQTDALKQEHSAQKRQIVTEVSTELLMSQSARSAVRLAEQSIESAQEAYRVTEALVKAGAATTTDLLESQAALTQARLNLVRAQYQLALAHVAIQHATGE